MAIFDAAFEAFERALDEHKKMEGRFELGRTLLALGSVRRRARQKRAAREAIEPALAIFEELGARLWSERAREELGRISGRRRSAPGELTKTEDRVAALAARGLSNKEIASTLCVSPHTVEAHLSSIYRKLGVRSRSALAGRLATPPHPSAKSRGFRDFPLDLRDLALAAVVPQASIASTFRGELIRPGDDRYESARRVWNGMIDKRPALIARCTGVDDVVSAVDFARENDLLVAVRSGGHNVAGNAVCDHGIVIDLSGLKGVHVDPDARTARAQPGATWGDFDRETQRFGLATTGGEVSTTGIAGLTLGGGFGWLGRRYAMSCDNLLSADLVTAAGEAVTASAAENPDLFWGLRGGGGNFGVVTSFEYRLHPVGQVFAGPIFYPFERAAEVLRSFGDYLVQAPDELAALAGIVAAPPEPFLPPEVHGQLVVAVKVCCAGDLGDAEEMTRPLRSLGQPLADLVAPMPYTAFQAAGDDGVPPGLRNYWKSSYLNDLTDEAVDTVVAHAVEITSPLSVIAIERLGGAVSRIDEHETAFGHRDAAFDLRILSLWTNPHESDGHIGWARELWRAMQPFSTGAVYVNNLGKEGDDRVRAAYAPAAYERLVALKDRYDRDNLFRLNQNIRPSSQRAVTPGG